MKTQYQEELEQRIATLEANYSQLQEQVTELDKDDELEQRIAAAKAQLAELRERGDDAWEDVKERAESAWKSLEEKFDKLKARFLD